MQCVLSITQFSEADLISVVRTTVWIFLLARDLSFSPSFLLPGRIYAVVLYEFFICLEDNGYQEILRQRERISSRPVEEHFFKSS